MYLPVSLAELEQVAPTVVAPLVRITVADQTLTIKRAWPTSTGRRTIEAIDSLGRVRALVQENGAYDLLDYGRDPHLPSLNHNAELVVHRAGKRAVERGQGVFIKHLRPKKVAAAVHLAQTMGEVARSAGFNAPQVHSGSDSAIVMSLVQGNSVLGLSDVQWEAAWAEFARCWPKLVTTGQPPDVTVHGPQAEVWVLSMWLQQAQTSGVRLMGERLKHIERECIAALQAIEHPVMGLAHRDVHDGQLLFDTQTGRIGLLDFDTAVLAPVELDLGNLIAHVHLRVLQGELNRFRAQVAVEHIVRASQVVGAREDALRVFTRVAWARLIGVYVYRPQWEKLAAFITNSWA